MGSVGGGVSFPVVFYDGETETSIGNVVVYASTDFKSFQSVLSHKIGISPHQFTVYLTDRNNSSKAKFYRRVPVTAKANFSLISRETDCLFLVVLKRSRRDRDRRRNSDARSSMATQKWNPPANLTLLRRNSSYGYGIGEGGLNGLSLGPDERRVCEECLRDVGGFHWCVYDPVTFAFRSPAGPIARPNKP